jgi:2-polyprenyl-3-methyl-5-hydroxy-6-metoxy-1,4-benzoquinol methylase
MRELTPQEELIYNDGERHIPGITHDREEFTRNLSSYIFFRKVIQQDLQTIGLSKDRQLRILDLGCGVGHGCLILSEIPTARVTGVDCSLESIEYARRYYDRVNIDYELADIVTLVSTMPQYDFVVSRHLFEHIPDGLRVALSLKWRYRLMINVPFDEPEGNPHHMVHRIREEHFSAYPNAEFLFEDLQGVTHDTRDISPGPNSIICICSHPDLLSVTRQIVFPVPAWKPEPIHEMVFRLKECEAELDQREFSLNEREASLNHREARYNSLLLVRIVRQLRRMFGRSG